MCTVASSLNPLRYLLALSGLSSSGLGIFDYSRSGSQTNQYPMVSALDAGGNARVYILQKKTERIFTTNTIAGCKALETIF